MSIAAEVDRSIALDASALSSVEVPTSSVSRPSKPLVPLVAVDGGVVEQVGGRLDVLLELELHLVDLAVRGVRENTVDLERTAEDLEVNRLGFAVGYGVGVVGVDVTEVRACGVLS